MAKKKGSIGVISYIRSKPRKRPGRHAKSYNKRIPNKKQRIGQGN